MLSPVQLKLLLNYFSVKSMSGLNVRILTISSGMFLQNLKVALTHICLLLRHQHYQYLTQTSEIPFMKLTSIASNIVTNVVPSDQTCGQINAKNQQYNCFLCHEHKNELNNNTCELDKCPDFKLQNI